MRYLFPFFLLAQTVFGQLTDPRAIIDLVDQNTVTTSVQYTAQLKISVAGLIREKEFVGYAQGKDRGYMEFTQPARDKGTRFLKLEDGMWIYLPAVEKATKIAGHMLRQSMMGSDFSYDDIMENQKLKESYDIRLTGSDTAAGKECYVLDLNAKVPEVAYQRRVLWVDQESFVPVKVELYAKSGKLMKEIDIADFQRIGGRNYPTRVKMINRLRQNTYSEMILTDIRLDGEVPARIFTKSYLERK
jgi:outer membrane lipoprotein-sorting protein